MEIQYISQHTDNPIIGSSNVFLLSESDITLTAPSSIDSPLHSPLGTPFDTPLNSGEIMVPTHINKPSPIQSWADLGCVCNSGKEYQHQAALISVEIQCTNLLETADCSTQTDDYLDVVINEKNRLLITHKESVDKISELQKLQKENDRVIMELNKRLDDVVAQNKPKVLKSKLKKSNEQIEELKNTVGKLIKSESHHKAISGKLQLKLDETIDEHMPLLLKLEQLKKEYNCISRKYKDECSKNGILRKQLDVSPSYNEMKIRLVNALATKSSLKDNIEELVKENKILKKKYDMIYREYYQYKTASNNYIWIYIRKIFTNIISQIKSGFHSAHKTMKNKKFINKTINYVCIILTIGFFLLCGYAYYTTPECIRGRCHMNIK